MAFPAGGLVSRVDVRHAGPGSLAVWALSHPDLSLTLRGFAGGPGWQGLLSGHRGPLGPRGGAPGWACTVAPSPAVGERPLPHRVEPESEGSPAVCPRALGATRAGRPSSRRLWSPGPASLRHQVSPAPRPACKRSLQRDPAGHSIPSECDTEKASLGTRGTAPGWVPQPWGGGASVWDSKWAFASGPPVTLGWGQRSWRC